MNAHDIFKKRWVYIGAGDGCGYFFSVLMLWDDGTVCASAGFTFSYLGPLEHFQANFREA